MLTQKYWCDIYAKKEYMHKTQKFKINNSILLLINKSEVNTKHECFIWNKIRSTLIK